MHEKIKDITTELSTTRYTNLLFILVMIYPFLESFSFVFLFVEDNLYVHRLKAEIYKTYVPYLLSIWFYFHSTKLTLKNPSIFLLTSENQKGKMIYDWLEEVNLNNVVVYLSKEENISARAFGTLKHKYIILTAISLEVLSNDELRALIIHEASHHYFGDVWKISLARSLGLSILLSRIIYGVLNIDPAIYVRESGVSTLLFFLPAFLALFSYALMSIGILAILRLRETIADNFTISILSDATPYIRLMSKVFNYRPQPKKTLKTKFSIAIPKLFNFHPKGKNRLVSLNNSKALMDDIDFGISYIGLLLGTLIGIYGIIEISILLSFPAVCILGGIVLYSIMSNFPNSKNIFHSTFTFAGSVALSVIFLTTIWSTVLISHPTGSSTINSDLPTEFYFTTPLIVFLEDFYLLFDNYIITFVFGGLFLSLFMFITKKINSLTHSIYIGPIKLSSILIFGLWFVLSSVIFLFWFDAFLPYPAIKYIFPRL